jgi:hypothetical protein
MSLFNNNHDDAILNEDEIVIKLTLSDRDRSLLTKYLEMDAEARQQKMDTYDISAALDRIINPVNVILSMDEQLKISYQEKIQRWTSQLASMLMFFVSTVSNAILLSITFEACLLIGAIFCFYVLWRVIKSGWPWYHVSMLSFFLLFIVGVLWNWGHLYEVSFIFYCISKRVWQHVKFTLENARRHCEP